MKKKKTVFSQEKPTKKGKSPKKSKKLPKLDIQVEESIIESKEENLSLDDLSLEDKTFNISKAVDNSNDVV